MGKILYLAKVIHVNWYVKTSCTGGPANSTGNLLFFLEHRGIEMSIFLLRSNYFMEHRIISSVT